MSCASSGIGRREFMTVCGGIAVLPVLAACASVAARPVPLTDGRVRLTLTEHPELAQAGGALKILPSGMREPVYVLALNAGAFAVLSPICTHRGCTVDMQGDRLVCPCHGSTFDREGKVLRGPAERPLQRFDATVSNGVVDIHIGAQG